MSEVVMYGAARPLPPEDDAPPKVRRIGDVRRVGPELVGSTYETKIILPGAPVTEPETEPDKAAGAETAGDAPDGAAAGGDAAPSAPVEAPTGRRSGR